MGKKSLKIHPLDNVAVVLEPVGKGEWVREGENEIMAEEFIDFGHKIALRDMKKGENVVKYGEVIGYLVADVPKGGWIHNHNMDCRRGK